jgi:hypothetical protein
MKLLSILLFLIVAVSILLVAILANPENLNNLYFWLTVGWLIALSGLNWFASTFMFMAASKSNSNQRVFGIVPSLNIMVFIYSIISATLLISTWYLNDFGILPNSHLILQITLFAIVASISVLMFIAAKASQIEEVKVAITKEELIQILKAIQSIKNLNEDKSKLIKELIELVRYSIPHLSKLNSKGNYEQLIMIFKNQNIKNNDDLSIEEIENAVFFAKNC